MVQENKEKQLKILESDEDVNIAYALQWKKDAYALLRKRERENSFCVG